MAENISKLALGSANFGLDYGVANKSGKISESELSKILLFAHEACIEVVDTAQAYGIARPVLDHFVMIRNSTL